jgi:glycosyltransferase involved in cell wall biosynthesis
MRESPQRVSVIIPVFNGARYLADAISSVLGQTHPPTEVVVVDDGSTDDSVSVARAFGPDVQVIRQENRGQPAAMNQGIAQTSGEYVAFLDADDLWERNKTARQLQAFDARPETECSVTWLRGFVSPELEHERAALDPSLLRDAPGYVASTLMTRRRLFDRIGGFDSTLLHANKTAWFLRAREHGARCEEIPEVLVRRRLHTSNISQQRASRSLDEYLHLVKRSLDRSRGART